MYPVQIIIKETPSNWSKATAILDTIKAKNGTDSVDTVSGAVTAGDLAEVGGLAGLNNRVTTVNCYAFGSVTANSASNHFGGFIGQAGGIHVNTAAGNFIPALSAQESGRPCFPRRRTIPKYKYPLKTGTAWGGALISRGDFAIMGKNIFRTEAEGGLSMKITVIGCGRWGSLITWYLDRIGHEVTLYGRAGSARMQRFLQTRKNDLLELPPSIALTTDLRAAQEAEVIIISIGSQGLRALLGELRPLGLRSKTFVLCMKGLEIGTGCRLSEIARAGVDASNRVAVWLGPGHVQEFYRGIPNCMVIDSDDAETKQRLVQAFSSDLIRFYYGTDLIGNEVGAAAKNVVGIAAGMLDGEGLSSLKGALMSRGTREVARLIRAMGGSELSAYGLCHLGDYEATVFSPYSHNRQFGESFVRGEEYKALAEGYYTVRAMCQLGEKYGVELPICRAVYDILYEGAAPQEMLNQLLRRSIKNEF